VAVALSGSRFGGGAPVGAVNAAKADPNPFRIGRPLVIPHAGGDGFYPEDTMVAWEHSMAEGGDVVDIDVSTSSDGVLIAFHDATLERTTNGAGPVAGKTWTELAKLDAGWGFKRNGAYPYRGKNVHIPTLEQVLRRFPKSLVTLDLKDQRASIVSPLCDLITRLGRTRDVYVGSDSNDQVLAFRKDCPSLRTSGTDAERSAMRAARNAGNTKFVTHQLVSQPSYLARDGTKRITAQFLAFSHRMDIAVLPWVVDNPNDLSDLIDLGVDGIYTRRPDLMVKLLRAKGKL
jgi:glycerophosphoryl diester phosphodiesterase